MTRRERIVVLLEHYHDVLNGVYDTNFDARGCSSSCGDLLCERYGCANEGILALMCRSWNHPSYRELERLLAIMQRGAPTAYWHVAETYIRPSRRRVAYCPRCKRTAPASAIGSLHKHGHGKTITLIPRIEPVIRKGVDPTVVELAIGWLERNWEGEPFVPDDLKGAVA